MTKFVVELDKTLESGNYCRIASKETQSGALTVAHCINDSGNPLVEIQHYGPMSTTTIHLNPEDAREMVEEILAGLRKLCPE